MQRTSTDLLSRLPQLVTFTRTDVWSCIIVGSICTILSATTQCTEPATKDPGQARCDDLLTLGTLVAKGVCHFGHHAL